jgi:integrase
MRGCMRQRSPGSWQLIVDLPRGADGKRRPFSTTFRGTKRAAAAELARLVLAAESGAPLDARTVTVAAFLERWLDEMAGHWAASTLATCRHIVRCYITPHLGAVQLQQLTALHVSGLYRQLLAGGRRDGTGLAPGSTRGVHRVLRQALGKAVHWDLIAKNICERVEPPPAPRAAEIAITRTEADRLLRAAAGTEMYLLVLLALGTGLRRGELIALRWEDLRLSLLTVNRAADPVGAAGVTKEPKGRRRRGMLLPPVLVTALDLHRQEQHALREFLGPAWQEHGLILTQRDGSPLHPKQVTDRFRTLAKRAGVQHLTLHSLRHGHASWLVAEGVDIYTISRRLGHASAGFTLNAYVHTVGSGDQHASERIDDLLTGIG